MMAVSEMASVTWSPQQAADCLGRSVKTMAKWRSLGQGCLWSNKAVRCRHLFWTVMAFILDSVGGRHRCDMRAPVPLVS